jgi:hypothetical protein
MSYDAMQPDEGIEHQQAWLKPANGFVKTRPVSVEVEAQAGRGDHLDRLFSAHRLACHALDHLGANRLWGFLRNRTAFWHLPRVESSEPGPDRGAEVRIKQLLASSFISGAIDLLAVCLRRRTRCHRNSSHKFRTVES